MPDSIQRAMTPALSSAERSDHEDTEDWVQTRVANAAEGLSLGPATISWVATQMRGLLSEKQLSQGELSRLAEELLDTLAQGEGDGDR